jgi:hypothetical protein
LIQTRTHLLPAPRHALEVKTRLPEAREHPARLLVILLVRDLADPLEVDQDARTVVRRFIDQAGEGVDLEAGA